MAGKKRRIVIEFGQSNASPNVGDRKSWEDQYPHLAIASSQTASATVPQSTRGSDGDIFTLTGQFPGGPTVDQNGTKVVGQYQKANLAGVAIENVWIPTFYNPSAHFQTFDVAATTYPGAAEIFQTPTDPLSPSRFLTNHQGQPAQHSETVTSIVGNLVTKTGHGFADNDLVAFGVDGGILPDGVNGKAVYKVKNAGANDFEIDLWPEVNENAAGALVTASGGSGTFYCFKTQLGFITRRRTSTQHYAAFGSPGPKGIGAGRLHLSVYPQFEPAPAAGEIVDIPVVLGEEVGTYTHSAAGPMSFLTKFGGLIDSGTFGVFPVANARVRQSLRDMATDTVNRPVRVTCEKMPLWPGRPIVFDSRVGWVCSSDGSATITMFAPTTHPWRVDDAITFSGVPGAPLVAGTRYWVNAVGANRQTLEVRATKAPGASIVVAATLFGIGDILPSNISLDTIYYVTRLAAPDFPATPLDYPFSFDSGGVNLNLAVAHSLVEHERMTLTGTSIPPQFRTGQDYYVKLVDYNTIQLSATPGGAAISFTYTAGQTCNLSRLEDLVSFYIAKEPGGEELPAGEGQDCFSLQMSRRETFAGCFSGLQLRCTAGANVGESVMLTHVEYDNTGGQDLALVHHEGSWTNTPTTGDTYVIEPPPVNGTPLAFDQWCKLLPLSPFEGRGQGDTIPIAGVMASGPPAVNEFGDTGVIANVPLAAKRGDVVKFYTETSYLPNQLVPGKPYYITGSVSGLAYFSESYIRDGNPDINYQPPKLTVSSVSGNQLSFAAAHQISQREPVSFFGTDLPTPIVQGTRYYANIVNATTIELQDLAGSTVTLTDTGSGTIDLYFPGSSANVWASVLSQDGRHNPYVPGFSYPNQHSLPARYQPFNGPQRGHPSGISAGATICLLMGQEFGEPIIWINAAWGGTSLGHKEVAATGVSGGFAWNDLRQRISWDPSDENGCYARLIEVLRATKLALDEMGDTGEVELVYMDVGEEDQAFTKLTERYGANLAKIKSRLRQDIADIGLCSYNPKRIPWVQAIPRRDFPSASSPNPAVVEAAVKAAAVADPWGRYIESSSELPMRNDADPYVQDFVHRTGKSMDIAGGWVFDEWKKIRYRGDKEVDVCNLALAHLGDTGNITSIAPPDGSADAALCAQFIDIAVQTMLERYDWAFASKRLLLTEQTNDRSDWLYRYAFPDVPMAAIRVLQQDAESDPAKKEPYVVEVDPSTDEQVIYTNVKGAAIRYTAQVEDLNRWTAQARLALSHWLASMLAGPKQKGDVGSQQAALAQQLAEAHVLRAAAQDARNASYRDPENDTPFSLRDR